MKKCPFCAAQIQDETVKCGYCGGMLDKFQPWELMPAKKEPEKWYFKTSTLITAFLCVGPFALPLLWINPKYSQKTKIIASVIIFVVCYYLGILMLNSLKSIGTYYQQINQLSL
jgi:hypothetical protein